MNKVIVEGNTLTIVVVDPATTSCGHGNGCGCGGTELVVHETNIGEVEIYNQKVIKINNATQTADGLMSKEDKIILDGATDEDHYTDDPQPALDQLVKRDTDGKFGTRQIDLGRDPTNPEEAATKRYVDNLINQGRVIPPVNTYFGGAHTIDPADFNQIAGLIAYTGTSLDLGDASALTDGDTITIITEQFGSNFETITDNLNYGEIIMENVETGAGKAGWFNADGLDLISGTQYTMIVHGGEIIEISVRDGKFILVGRSDIDSWKDRLPSINSAIPSGSGMKWDPTYTKNRFGQPGRYISGWFAPEVEIIEPAQVGYARIEGGYKAFLLQEGARLDIERASAMIPGAGFWISHENSEAGQEPLFSSATIRVGQAVPNGGTGDRFATIDAPNSETKFGFEPDRVAVGASSQTLTIYNGESVLIVPKIVDGEWTWYPVMFSSRFGSNSSGGGGGGSAMTGAQIIAAIDGVQGGSDWRTNADRLETNAFIGANIKSLYEAEADTNAFSDAYKTKVDGISWDGLAIANLLDAALGSNSWRNSEFVGFFETEAELPATSSADQFAIVTDSIEVYVFDGAGGWKTKFFNAYDITNDTVTKLTTPANWDSNNLYTGPAIAAEDLVAGKKYVNSAEKHVVYYCETEGTAASEYWVRLDLSNSGGGGGGTMTGAEIVSALDAEIGHSDWQEQGFDVYDVSAGTITKLLAEANWWGTAGPNVYDTAAGGAIDNADLVIGKKYVKSDENLVFECVNQNGSAVWVRMGNRLPVSMDINLFDEGVSATTGVKKTFFLTQGDLTITHVDGSVGNVAHAGGSLDIEVLDDTVAVASVSIADGTNYNTSTTSLPATIEYGSKVEVSVTAVPATAGEGHMMRINGFLTMAQGGAVAAPGGGGGGSFDVLTYFDVVGLFDDATNMTIDTVEQPVGVFTDYFTSTVNSVVAHQGSANGQEIFSNNTSGHATLSSGWKKVANGIELHGSEISIKVRQYDGTTENGLNHGNGEDFVFAYLEYHEGGMSGNRRKKHNGVADKLQTNNPKNWKHEDQFNTQSDGLGVDEGDVSLPYGGGFNPANGTLMLFAKMRDATNQRYVQWVGEIVSGNTQSDLLFNDTVTQSTADGQALYLKTNQGLDNDSSDELEHHFQEGSIWRRYYYKKLPVAAGNFADVDAKIKALYEDLCTELG